MKVIRTSISCLALATAMACAPKALELAPASPADVAVIAKIVATFDSCARVGAADVLMTYVTSDVVAFMPDQPALVGKEAMLASYRALYAAFTLDMHHAPIETHVVGSLLVHRGDATGTITPKAGGALMRFNNKYLMLFRRQVDGSLKLWRVAANSNIPPAPPPAVPKKK